MKAPVLVTGATGAVGLTLTEVLLENGYAVRAFVRGSSDITHLPQDVVIYKDDITNTDALQQAAAGCRVIFHLAAMLHVNNPGPDLRVLYQRVNVGGTAAVVEAAQSACVERVILFSTINVYGPSNGAPAWHEDSPLNGESLYAQTKIAAERVAFSAENHHNQPLCTVLRLAAVYGPRMKGNYIHLYKAIKRHMFIPIGQGINRRTVVYDRDLASAAILAANSAAAAGEIFNITDGQVHSFNTILQAMYSAARRRRPRFALPMGPLSTATKLTSTLIQAIGYRSSTPTDLLNKIVEDVAVSGTKAIKELDYTPQITLQDGWQRISTTLNSHL